MEYAILCSNCGKETQDPLHYRCSCGEPLNVCLKSDFERQGVRQKNYTIWRYEKFFPYVRKSDIITLGEGWTPLVMFSDKVYFKLESLNPTGSFKDRGSAVLLSALVRLVKEAGGYISEDSSGNAGASVAAYASRAGLRASIYVPQEVSGPKFSQIRFYGAETVKVSGGRSRVSEEAQKAAEGKFYVGHILHPLFRDGMRSLAYEIAEQLGWDCAERVYVPVSAGTLLLGVIEGFRHLVKSDAIDSMPKMVACQTEQVSPLYHRMRNLSYTPPSKIESIADALVSVNPPLLNLMVERLKEVKGEVVAVQEDKILNAFAELSGTGFFVEPSSAVAYAAFKMQSDSGKLLDDRKNVVVLTGTGMKTALRFDQLHS